MTNKNGRTIKIDNLVITVSEKLPDGSFQAWLGDYDLGCMVGWGGSAVAAAADLLDKEHEKRVDALIAQFTH